MGKKNTQTNFWRKESWRNVGKKNESRSNAIIWRRKHNKLHKGATHRMARTHIENRGTKAD